MPTQQQETIEFIVAKGFDINTITGLKTALKWLKKANFHEFLSYAAEDDIMKFLL